MEEKEQKKKRKKDKIRLDEVLKSLFQVSKPLVINMLNYIFKTNITQDTEISYLNTDLIGMDYSMIRADLFVDAGNKSHCHIEFQLVNDKKMVYRMLKYGIEEAMRYSKEQNGEMDLIYLPNQAVMFLEENREIKDKLQLGIVPPDTKGGKDKMMVFEVDVHKAWQIGREEKVKNGLYLLLPLEILGMRKLIEKTKGAKGEKYKELANEILKSAENITSLSQQLMLEKKITPEDNEKIVNATVYLLDYYSEKYGDKKLEEVIMLVNRVPLIETEKRVRRETEERVEKAKRETILKLASSMMDRGFSIDEILAVSEMPREEAEILKKELESVKKEIDRISPKKTLNNIIMGVNLERKNSGSEMDILVKKSKDELEK